jgi:hypothetical protein
LAADEVGLAADEVGFAADEAFAVEEVFGPFEVFAAPDGFAADEAFAVEEVFGPFEVFAAADEVFAVDEALGPFEAPDGFAVRPSDDFDAAAARGPGASASRRVPIRSGRVDGSAASTPFSSFLGFAFFFGFSTLSAMALRVYGSRSGRGARPPSTWHPEHSAAPSYTLWVTFARSRD